MTTLLRFNQNDEGLHFRFFWWRDSSSIMGGSDEEVRGNIFKLPITDFLLVATNHKSHDKVMVLGSEEEQDIVTLDESSITSLLAGAGVTITRTSGSSSSGPRASEPTRVKPATTARVGIPSSSKTTTPSGGQPRLAPSGQGFAPLSQKPRPAQVWHIVIQYRRLCSASDHGDQEERGGRGGPTGPWR